MGGLLGVGHVYPTNRVPPAFYQFLDAGGNVAHMVFVIAILSNQNL
jgi:hypothetical protein